MRLINKKVEPKSLTQHKANKPASYEGLPFPAKEELRQNLLSEQGYLCCYCLKRIPEHAFPYMKIEHFKSQDKHPELQLQYSNLLGACTGNEGQPKKIQTCDTKKGSDDFSLHPCITPPICSDLFKYTPDGSIICEDSNLQKEIDSILNLNSQSLQDQRAEVYEYISSIVHAESKKSADKKVKLKVFRALLIEWTTPDAEGKLKPYCMVAVYYLKKKIIQYQ